MNNHRDLILGAFYRAILKAESDVADDDWEPSLGWQDEIQPARFNGWNAAGEMLWNFMGFDGSSNWLVPWIGGARCQSCGHGQRRCRC